jgi:hypothetical protein
MLRIEITAPPDCVDVQRLSNARGCSAWRCSAYTVFATSWVCRSRQNWAPPTLNLGARISDMRIGGWWRLWLVTTVFWLLSLSFNQLDLGLRGWSG